MLIHKVENYFGGEFVKPNNNKYFERISPVSGEPLTSVPDSDMLDLVGAIQAANKAMSVWNKRERVDRTEALLSFILTLSRSIEESATDIAKVQCLETGMPFQSSLSSVLRGIDYFRFFSERLRQYPINSTIESESGSVRRNALPVGIVGLILPCYCPAETLLIRLAAGLAAGNVVIAKGSSYTAQTNQRIAMAIQNSSLLPGFFALLQGRGEQIGDAIVEHPGISVISFAGKTETGRKIQSKAAETLKRTQLSMSACNSALVFAGVDLDQAATSIIYLSLTGHVPRHLRVAKVYVQATIYKEFLEILSRKMSGVIVGDPLHENADLGPVARSEDQIQFNSAIELAIKEKGKLLEFSIRENTMTEKGNFVQPKVFYDNSMCSTLQQEEILGPLALVDSFKYQIDGIKLVNNSPFGQISYLFHPDNEKALTIAEKIMTGRIVVNPREIRSCFQFPIKNSFGGLKMSGIGSDSAVDLFQFYSRNTLISTL